MSDRLEFQVDTRTLVAAKQALDAVAGASRTAEQAAKLYRDAQGRLRQENGRFATEAQKAAAGLQTQAAATRKAASETGMLADAMNRLKGAVGAYLTIQTAVRVIKEADAWQAATARLALYTGGLEQARVLQERLALTALQTGQNVSGLVQSYGRMAQSARQLGASQEQLLAATKAVSDAFRVGGTDAQQASAAAQQLAQALGSGVLAGDELRSILENSGRLAQAVADGLGVSVGQMRELGKEGELTSRATFLALLSQSRKLAEETAKLPLTVSQGWQNMLTAATVAVARLDQAIGGTQFLARLLDGTASVLLAAYAPDLYQRQRGMQDVRSNRALSPQGAAMGFNQNRAMIELNNAAIAQILQNNPAIRATRGADGRTTYSIPNQWRLSPGEMQRASEGLETVRRNALDNDRRQGRVLAYEEFFAQGGGISQDAFRREIAAERGRGAAADVAERARTRAARNAASVSDRWIDSQAQARNGTILGGRPGVGSLSSSSFDEIFGSITAARRAGRVRLELPDSIRRAASELDRPRLAGMDLVRANIQPIVELQERQRRAAEETRRLWSENLSRGIYDGFRQPIADFLMTWKFSARTAGDFLRQALANAIASVAANELQQLLARLWQGVRQAPPQSKNDFGLSDALSLFNRLTTPQANRGGGGGDGGGSGGRVPVNPFTLAGFPIPGSDTDNTVTGGRWGGPNNTPFGVVESTQAWLVKNGFGSVAKIAPPAIAATIALGWGNYVASISGGNSAARAANAAFAENFRRQQAALAMRRADDQAYLRAVGDGMVIGAPSGYDVAPARGMAIQTVNITVPEGTTRQQAESIVRELQSMAGAQTGNPSRWAEVYVS